MSNIYDLAGNVWEYTYTTMLDPTVTPGDTRTAAEIDTANTIHQNLLNMANATTNPTEKQNLLDQANTTLVSNGTPAAEMRVVRGADYCSEIDDNQDFGAASFNIIPMEADKQDRNESGFRVMLYLVENKATLGKYAEYNTKMLSGSVGYNNPVIPAGYAPVNDGADWNNLKGNSWNDGLVIQDQLGNQFVWVPCTPDGWHDTVKYGEWATSGESYSGTED